jgi:hypothetical protein
VCHALTLTHKTFNVSCVSHAKGGHAAGGGESGADDLAASVAGLPPGGVREAKRLMREGGGRDQRARYDAENAATRAALGDTSAADLFAGFRRRGR